jgi:uncharacterized membrane protein YagU involved in acid resistance
MGSSSRASRAILAAGLTCFVLDGCSALVQSWYLINKGISAVRPERVFQGVAYGILGPDTYKQGASSALLGVGIHLMVALTAAAVFYALSRAIPFLLKQALLSGVLYGIAVHLFMQFVVIPLSVIGRRPINMRSFVSGLVIHMIVVGPSIALTIRKYSR